MRRDPVYQAITADEFLKIGFGTDRKFELDIPSLGLVIPHDEIFARD